MGETTSDLCLSLFSWVSFRKAKGGIKLRVGMNHKGNLSEFVTITEARQHEVSEGRSVVSGRALYFLSHNLVKQVDDQGEKSSLEYVMLLVEHATILERQRSCYFYLHLSLVNISHGIVVHHH